MSDRTSLEVTGGLRESSRERRSGRSRTIITPHYGVWTKPLARQGVPIAYPTLHRFAVLELQFGKTATTIPVLDGEPGHELQVDTGWVGWLTLPERKRRRFRAWIFTAVRSRHRFVYPTFEETTARAIEACEAAWDFFGGVPA